LGHLVNERYHSSNYDIEGYVLELEGSHRYLRLSVLKYNIYVHGVWKL